MMFLSVPFWESLVRALSCLSPVAWGRDCVLVRAREGVRVSGACEPGVCARNPCAECGRRDTAACRTPGVPPS